MSKHTPGPWRKCGFNVSVDPKCYYLLKNDSHITAGELEANAHLIAAAPDLLEACRASCEAVQKAFGIMDNSAPAFAAKSGYWEDAEIWLNNAKGVCQAAIEKTEL